ncbi:MAG: carboxypeptidase-like regulatory domain-containing protein [Gemmatimonadota bacterium]|nr:carboxypeptidase-like regulatory domain-containing protein [Gemmatimonadota bacterium]
MRRFAIMAVALTATGCGIVGKVCTLEARFSVIAQARDSRTGGQLGAPPTGTITDGPYRETMNVYLGRDGAYRLTAGEERRGTYDVEIRAEGYRPWRQTGVEVKHDGCHVVTAELDVGMVPLASP